MLIRTTKLVALIACLLLLTLTAFAQQNQTQNKQSDPQWVDFSGFKGKIFDIKHRDPVELVQVLAPLGSGFKGATIQANRDYKTLTVRDFPENIAVIEEAIKRLDTPLPPKPLRPMSPNIEITAYILIASNNEVSGNQVPPQLKDVIAQLQTTLSYKSYQLLTPISQRVKLDSSGISSTGATTWIEKDFSARYRFQINRVYSEKFSDDNSVVALDDLVFSLGGDSPADQTQIGGADIRTKLNIRDGEKLVVGTASLKDKALILVLTAKVIK